jgi:hypothetical protein
MSLVSAVTNNLPAPQKVAEISPLEIGHLQALFANLVEKCRLFDDEKSVDLYMELPLKKEANEDSVRYLFGAFFVEITEDKLFIIISVDPGQFDGVYESLDEEEDYGDD